MRVMRAPIFIQKLECGVKDEVDACSQVNYLGCCWAAGNLNST